MKTETEAMTSFMKEVEELIRGVTIIKMRNIVLYKIPQVLIDELNEAAKNNDMVKLIKVLEEINKGKVIEVP